MGKNNFTTNNLSIIPPGAGTATSSGVIVGRLAAGDNTNYNSNRVLPSGTGRVNSNRVTVSRPATSGHTNYNANAFLPSATETATSSGVMLSGPATSGNSSCNGNANRHDLVKEPPPPTYDQAIGNKVKTLQTARPRSSPIHVYGKRPSLNDHQMIGERRFLKRLKNPPLLQTATHSSSSTYVYGRRPSFNDHQAIGGRPSLVVMQHQTELPDGPESIPPLGPEPVNVICPACHALQLTRIEFEPNSRTHVIAALLCLFGLLCCVCIPYFVGSCMKSHHFCGNCGKFLGSYSNKL